MFICLQIKYDWVLDVIAYSSVERVIEVFEEKVVRLAEDKFDQLGEPNDFVSRIR